MNPTTVIYSCGCTSVLPIPEGLAKATLRLANPSDAQDVFPMEIVRISVTPPVFIEGATERPEWGKACHAMIPFDIRVFEKAYHKEFETLFGPWREKFGPMVPQCWLPDILAGRGRFFGLWHWQAPARIRKHGHLRVVDAEVDTETLQEVPESPPPNPSAPLVG